MLETCREAWKVLDYKHDKLQVKGGESTGIIRVKLQCWLLVAVITEYKLGAGAVLRSIEAAEAAKKALLKQSNDAPASAVPIKLAKRGKPRPEPVVSRSAFPRSFGKQNVRRDPGTQQ